MPTTSSAERLIKDKEFAERVGWSVRTIWKRSREDPKFPQPVKLGEGSTRWRESDVAAFIDKLKPAFGGNANARR